MAKDQDKKKKELLEEEENTSKKASEEKDEETDEELNEEETEETGISEDAEGEEDSDASEEEDEEEDDEEASASKKKNITPEATFDSPNGKSVHRPIVYLELALAIIALVFIIIAILNYRKQHNPDAQPATPVPIRRSFPRWILLPLFRPERNRHRSTIPSLRQ